MQTPFGHSFVELDYQSSALSRLQELCLRISSRALLDASDSWTIRRETSCWLRRMSLSQWGYDPVEYDPSIWNHPRSARIIHVDSTRADVDNFYFPAVEVLGDIAASLTGLAELLNPLVLAPDVERFLSKLASKRKLRL
jgi:hypothetical protein